MNSRLLSYQTDESLWIFGITSFHCMQHYYLIGVSLIQYVSSIHYLDHYWNYIYMINMNIMYFRALGKVRCSRT